MDRSKQLGEEKVGKLLLKFSIPAIVGMLVSALYNIVDRIFIGNGVGALAITGVGVTFPFSTIIMAFGMLVAIGAGAIISIKLGENKREEAEKILGNTFILISLTSILVTIFGLVYLDKLLRIFGASDSVISYARDYGYIILLGAVFNNVGFGMNNLIRAEGNPKIAMYTMLIGAVLNIILDPIFIFVFNMGVKGAAIATVISQAANSIWVISYFMGKKSILKLKVKNFKIEKNLMIQIFAIGMSPCLMQIAASIVTIVFNKNLLNYGGDFAIGAMATINSISMLFLMPIFGINQGSQPIIGYNYGAKYFERVKEALKLSILAGTAISTIGFIMVEAFPQALIKMFNNDPNLVKIGSNGIRIFLCMLPIIGFQIVSSNYFQAVGKPKKSIFLSLSRQVILLIPLVFILPKFFGLNGVWMAAPVSDCTSSLLTAFFLLKEIKHLEDKHEKLTQLKLV